MTSKLKITAESLNRGCACRTFDPSFLKDRFARDTELSGIYEEIYLKRPHLFSATTVFISSSQYESIKEIISSVESVIAMKSFESNVLKKSETVAHHNPGPLGVFMGYDFHLSEDGPKLIEINTNAGGALLNLELARAQEMCCIDLAWEHALRCELSNMENIVWEMFQQEWKLQRGSEPLKTIAIVDDAPQEQYLYPEFILFQKLFSKFGIKAVIGDAQKLTWKDNKLYLDNEIIDMVYNRVTDFYLKDHEALKMAYLNNGAVITPAPRHHALYANKLNLEILSHENLLLDLGVEESNIKILVKGIPATQKVTNDFWEKRKRYFFKPASGFGSKAAYRGDKMTRSVWNEISSSEYVAQNLIPPSQRVIEVDGKESDLKLDIRAYVYQGRIQLLAARLYSGQTTNFRTQGGGFAPVFIMPN